MRSSVWSALCLILCLSLGLAGCAGVSPTPESPGATPLASLPGSTPTAEPAPATPTSPTATATPLPTEQPLLTPTPSRDLSAVRIDLQPIAGGLDQPVDIANAADGTGRLFIVEKPGRIRVLQDSELSSVPFLDITGRVGSEGSEQGLLGLAFHPDYVRNGSFFVSSQKLGVE